jgi:hypothetical protein
MPVVIELDVDEVHGVLRQGGDYQHVNPYVCPAQRNCEYDWLCNSSVDLIYSRN